MKMASDSRFGGTSRAVSELLVSRFIPKTGLVLSLVGGFAALALSTSVPAIPKVDRTPGDGAV